VDVDVPIVGVNIFSPNQDRGSEVLLRGCNRHMRSRTPTTDIMKKVYLNEFLDNGLIDTVQSQLDHRQICGHQKSDLRGWYSTSNII